MARIEIDGVRKSFGTKPVLRGVELDIRPGEFVSLVGPSGCGKSTLLRIIAGLERADAGDVRLDGIAMGHTPARARDLAMVFQSYALYPHLTVAQNVAVPLEMRRLGTLQRLPFAGRLLPGAHARRREIGAEVARVLDVLGIVDLADRKPGQLSGGQRQRVALGRAMVRRPRAFLMDEPLSNLDATLRTGMRTEIAQLHRRLGATFIYVTHDQAEAMTMSDRIAVMMEGAVLQVGAPDAIYADPQDLRVAAFIGSPAINVVDAASGALLGLPPGAAAGAHRLAFRAEAATLDAPERTACRGRVVHLENFGADLYVHLAVAGEGAPLVARRDPLGPRPHLGEWCGIRVPAERLLAFDTRGRRVRHGGVRSAA